MATTILPVSIALWSGYALSLSYTAIQDVRNYESQTETAAKYLNTAEDALHHTRTTQAAGAIATALSLVTSLTIFGSLYTSAHHSPYIGITAALLNAGTAYAARVHIQGYWRGKAKVPMVDKYNDAIDKSNELIKALGWLAAAWAADVVSRGISLVV